MSGAVKTRRGGEPRACVGTRPVSQESRHPSATGRDVGYRQSSLEGR